MIAAQKQNRIIHKARKEKAKSKGRFRALDAPSHLKLSVRHGRDRDGQDLDHQDKQQTNNEKRERKREGGNRRKKKGETIREQVNSRNQEEKGQADTKRHRKQAQQSPRRKNKPRIRNHNRNHPKVQYKE